MTNITDLNADCLRKIFDYLTIRDLMNLAEANVNSYWMAEPNKNKGDSNSVKVNRYKEIIRETFRQKAKPNENKIGVSISVNSAPNDIKLLNHFGREISALWIDYNEANRRYESALEMAVINNCRETLTEINFSYCDTFAMYEIQEPFPNVEYVEFNDCLLGSKLGQLRKWFPKMSSLVMRDTHSKDSEYFHHHFAFLDKLAVQNSKPEEGKMIFTNLNLKIFSNLNPQLKSLSIRHDLVSESESGVNALIINWDMMSFISRNLKQLNILRLDLEDFYFQTKWQSVVTFENLTTLDFEFSNFDVLDKFKIISPKLNELTLSADHDQLNLSADQKQSNYEAIAVFVGRYTKPKKIKIKNHYFTFDIGNRHMINIVKTVPNLSDVYIECMWSDQIPNAMINFLAQSKTLTKLTGVFNFEHSDARYGEMRLLFNNKVNLNDCVANTWTYTFDDSIKTFLNQYFGGYVADSVHFVKEM